jgi:hypothetical protein
VNRRTAPAPPPPVPGATLGGSGWQPPSQTPPARAEVLTYSGSRPALFSGYTLGVLAAAAFAPAAGALSNELFPAPVRASVAGWLVAASVLGAVGGLVSFGAVADPGHRFGVAALAGFLPALLGLALFPAAARNLGMRARGPVAQGALSLLPPVPATEDHGFGELPGVPGAAAELAEDGPGLELGVSALGGWAQFGVGAVGGLLGGGLAPAPVRSDEVVTSADVALIGQHD